MPSIDSLETKFGRFAVPHLIPVIAIFQLLNCVLLYANANFVEFLALIPSEVARGQIWRLFTWILMPGSMSPFWALISAVFYSWMGHSLETQWGTFRMNLFVLISVVAVIATTFILSAALPPLWTGAVPGLAGYFLASIIVSFALLAPEYEIMLMGIIPIKMKWIGIFSAGMTIFAIIGSLPIAPLILATHAGFFALVAPSYFRDAKLRAAASVRRAKFDSSKPPEGEAFHTCATCGTDDVMTPEAEFRFAADGEEYCVSCLKKKGSE